MHNARTDQTTRNNFRKAWVLVVEDNPDQWQLTERAMQRCLPEVTTVLAATQEEALACLNQWVTADKDLPKLILLDLYLPSPTDGWNLLHTIRHSSAPYKHIPVVMLSASSNRADIVGSYQQGTSSYLVKPVVFDEWVNLFQGLRTYWWETVTLPDTRPV